MRQFGKHVRLKGDDYLNVIVETLEPLDLGRSGPPWEYYHGFRNPSEQTILRIDVTESAFDQLHRVAGRAPGSEHRNDILRVLSALGCVFGQQIEPPLPYGHAFRKQIFNGPVSVWLSAEPNKDNNEYRIRFDIELHADAIAAEFGLTLAAGKQPPVYARASYYVHRTFVAPTPPGGDT